MYDIYCKLRDEKKVKDIDVSRETGVIQSTFSDWKKGKSTPKLEKLQKIADYFGVSVNVFLGNEIGTKEHQQIRDNHQTKQLVDDFLKLDLDDRRTILLMLQAMLDNQKYKKDFMEGSEIG